MTDLTPVDRAPATRDTEQADRIAIGVALIRSGVYDDGEVDLLQWHPCEPCHRKDGPRRGGCACSGVPYVSDEVWRALRPVIAAIRTGEQHTA